MVGTTAAPAGLLAMSSAPTMVVDASSVAPRQRASARWVVVRKLVSYEGRHRHRAPPSQRRVWPLYVRSFRPGLPFRRRPVMKGGMSAPFLAFGTPRPDAEPSSPRERDLRGILAAERLFA